MDNSPEILEANARDLAVMQTALAELAQISAAVYRLEGQGIVGANMKAAAIAVIQSTERNIRMRLDPPIKAVVAALQPPEPAPDEFPDEEPEAEPA